MTDFGAYIKMGGYGAFIWPSYGVALLVLGGLSLASWLRLRRAARALQKTSVPAQGQRRRRGR